MPEGFPLPVSSYRELVKIIQGYGRVGSDASLADVAQVTAMGETVISGNNKFLLAVGIIQGGKRKTITPIGGELAKALEHELPDQIPIKWRAVADANDFLQKVIAAVRIRKGMDESTLESHIAYTAGQPKTPVVSTGAGAVVDILRAAELLTEDSGNLVATTPTARTIPVTVQQSLSISDPMAMSESVQVSHQGVPTKGLGRVDVQLRIEITVQCAPNDLDSLGAKLRKVIQDLGDSTELQKKPDATPFSGSGSAEA